jgi:alkanesulfonate monooxygenase SsuD/methylene tetrahydromethanopterin reductase-like flavin-dependent oxidoreductase (luciferase family)
MFTMRFDMRAPGSGAPIRELYEAALEMAAWGERQGCIAIQVSEHHAASDGYLPAPLLLASAIAARTEKLPVQIAALLVPLHDPVDLAEQMAVLDIVSGGRVSYVCAIGYREEEYASFGQAMKGRGKRLEESIELMRRAWQGEPFDWNGRRVHVTPRPLTEGGPLLLMGGNSEIVVRRAARLGIGMITQGGGPSLEPLYLEACEEAGTQPGMFIHSPPGTITSAFVARDPDRAWSEMGPHMLHDARMYAAWMTGAAAASKSVADSVEALRAENGAYRILTPDEAIAHVESGRPLMTQPLSGGMPPELAWQSLELIASEVLPALDPRTPRQPGG